MIPDNYDHGAWLDSVIESHKSWVETDKRDIEYEQRTLKNAMAQVAKSKKHLVEIKKALEFDEASLANSIKWKQEYEAKNPTADKQSLCQHCSSEFTCVSAAEKRQECANFHDGRIEEQKHE